MSNKSNLKTEKPFPLRLYGQSCWERYRQMRKKEKTKFISDIALTCQVSRQHARRHMAKAVKTEGFKNIGFKTRAARPGRKAQYGNDDELIRWLQWFWRALNFPNTKVFPDMVAEWMPYFDDKECPPLVRQKLVQISSSTMEKLLRSYKREHGKKHFAATKNKGRLKKLMIRVPERRLDFKITSCGYFEGDTVAHCGDSLRGRHGWSLNVVCIYSAWTESATFLGKEEENIVNSLIDMRARLPFPMKGYHSDCGSEFLNDTVCTYLEDPKNYVTQTHGRAYKKNDQARVEQKNWTQVRQSFGYERVEDQRVIDCMNDIYQNELRIIRNFFTPTLKQKSKMRVGSKYKRKFEKPRTPYERLMEDPGLSQNIKDELTKQKQSFNPFEIQRQLEEKLKFFEKLLKNQSKVADEIKRTHDADKKEAA